MKKYDVTALGELLIDFTENGLSPQGNRLMEANPGGAPCNVLAMLASLGHKTAFLGMVGEDLFGCLLRDVLREVGIETKGLRVCDSANTTLAFVHTKEDGDREFSFYRNPGADRMLSEKDLDMELLEDCKIFHFGSLSMTHDICRTATRKAIETAEKSGALLSFDPNLREPLWESMEDAKAQIAYGMGHCQILKISDNELQWFTGMQDFDEGIAALQAQYHIPLILLSAGRDGSKAYMGGRKAEVPAFLGCEAVETTGAGDTFCGCVLHYILEHGWKEYTQAELEEMLRFANAAAAAIVTRKGALRVMPEKAEILAILEGK